MSSRMPDARTEITSFGDLLGRRADRQPDQRAFTFLQAGTTAEAHLTYAALDRQARAIATRLQDRVAPGARALLLYPPGLEYIAALFGCFYAGVVAVPAYPPDPSRLARTLPRLQALAADARPVLALTTAALASMGAVLGTQAPALSALPWLATDALPDAPAQDWRPPARSSTDLALLQ